MAMSVNTIDREYDKFVQDDAGNTAIRVKVTGGITSYTEDAQHVSGDSGIQILTVRRDIAASSAGADGDYATLNTDSLGHLWSREGFAPGYEDNTVGVAKVEQRFSNTYISTATTTVIKASAGFLHSITLSETAAGTISVYDNATGVGTVISVLKASIAEQTFIFDVVFAAGCTIITTAASKLSVSWR